MGRNGCGEQLVRMFNVRLNARQVLIDRRMACRAHFTMEKKTNRIWEESRCKLTVVDGENACQSSDRPGGGVF